MLTKITATLQGNQLHNFYPELNAALTTTGQVKQVGNPLSGKPLTVDVITRRGNVFLCHIADVGFAWVNENDLTFTKQ